MRYQISAYFDEFFFRWFESFHLLLENSIEFISLVDALDIRKANSENKILNQTFPKQSNKSAKYCKLKTFLR